MKKYDLFIFAGERSAEILAINLIEEILKKKNLSLCGVTGPKMKKMKIDTILSLKDFEVMGFFGILKKLPSLIKNFFYLRKTILKLNPKVCIFIDYPDFNLRLERSLKKKGYKGKIIHYICPSIWAWRKKRIKIMEQSIDLLLSIFPFEKKYFKNSTIKIDYIGNPLITNLKKYAYEKNWKYSTNALIGIFPGSREKEIKNNLPIQLKIISKIFKKYPNYCFVISIADKSLENIIYALSAKYKLILKERLIFYPSLKNYDLMKHLNFAIATSGTVNLELALHKIPTIVIYKIKPLDLLIAKNILKIKLPYYCIVNILANKLVFPELFGSNLTEESLYHLTNKMLNENSFKKNIIFNLNKVINAISTPKNSYQNVNKKAALHILNILNLKNNIKC